MPTTEPDFDVRNSDLTIGLEIEYPAVGPDDEYLVSRGQSTNELQNTVCNNRWPLSGRPVYDGTVGLEIVSDTMPLADAKSWYGEVIEHIQDEYHEYYQPTGLMATGNTAGLHVHLSPLSEEQARKLYELSQEPWMQVLFCSSIANGRDSNAAWPVFRGGRYCQMSFGSNHYDCVNRRGRGSRHYEWRMPEPMVPEHIEVLAEFLHYFEQDPDLAIEYAQDILDSADDRITSIQRAEAVGMGLEDMPSVHREPPTDGDRDWFETVAGSARYPRIYTIEYQGDTFFAFNSDIQTTVEIAGIEFNPQEDVLWADDVEPVDDTDYAEEIQRAFAQNGSEQRETDATKELKKIVKK